MIRLLAALSLLATPALAQSMTGAEFAAWATGKTIFFAKNGAPYGAEQYRANRTTVWAVPDGECTEGTWWDEAGLICFSYDAGKSAICWEFAREDGRVTARLADGDPPLMLDVVGETEDALSCKFIGPGA